MKRPVIDQLVYGALFPRPKASDPRTFSEFLARYLVFEVRQEVHSFYGHLDTQEAKYPGLDYCNPIHRIRLGRWPWHRRLFRAFDSLRLTPAEIAQLTKWEGTKWAKERYEKEQNISIQDTAAEGMPDYRMPSSRLSEPYTMDDYVDYNNYSSHQATDYESFGGLSGNYGRLASIELPTQAPQMSHAATLQSRGSTATAGSDIDAVMNDVNESTLEDSDDGINQSIGLQLNERLRERVAAHNAGDTSQPLDEDWEQWLKTAIETGNLTVVAQHIGRLADLPFVHSSYYQSPVQTTGPRESNAQLFESHIVPAHILEAARLGNWSEVTQILHSARLRSNEQEGASEAVADTAATRTTSSSPSASRNRPRHSNSSSWRRTYSDLRLPGQ